MKPVRPVYLDLRRIRQPLPAIVSILHRISGILLFLTLPATLLLFEVIYAQQHPADWLAAHFWPRLGLSVFLAAYLYHLLAGVRFLLLDMDWGLKLNQSRRSAAAVLLAGLLGIVLIGAVIW